jgi:hypothetical protein
MLIDGTHGRKLMLAFILSTHALTPSRTPSSNLSHIRVRDLLDIGS